MKGSNKKPDINMEKWYTTRKSYVNLFLELKFFEQVGGGGDI